MIFETGTYIGTGSAATITLTTSETPDWLFVRSRDTAVAGWHRHSSMATSKKMPTITTSTNGIASLGAGVFSIGTDSTINTSSETYEYFLFADDGHGDFAVGTYTGDGNATQNVSISFNPECVFVFDLTVAEGEFWRCAAGTTCQRMSVTGDQVNGITALGTSEFTVGSSLNTSSQTYYYVAFKQVSGFIDTQVYTGSSSADTITLNDSFTPDFAMVANVGIAGRRIPYKLNIHPAGTCSNLSNTAYGSTDKIQDFGVGTMSLGLNRDVGLTGEDGMVFYLKSNPAGGGGSTGYEVIQQYYRNLMG